MHVLSTAGALLGRYAIFGRALASVALLGVGQRSGFYPNIISDVSITVRCLPIRFFCFTRNSIPWIFACTGFSYVSNLDINFRSSLRS